MTGRAAGYCGGSNMPGYLNPLTGQGFGGGRGFGGRGFGGGGRGWRHWFYATGLPGWMRFGRYLAPYGYPVPHGKPDPETEKSALKSHADMLQEELDLIKQRLAEIESKAVAK
jgi:hypothetical protein